MPHRIFDTTRLITQLKKLRAESTRADAQRLARELIDAYDTRAIASPVEIEVLAGVPDPHELELTEVFLAEFEVIDHGNIPQQDWQRAKQIAKRVIQYDPDVPRRHRKREPRQNPKTKARQLGDCFIAAIANRLHYDPIPITDDRGMKKQAGRTAGG